MRCLRGSSQIRTPLADNGFSYAWDTGIKTSTWSSPVRLRTRLATRKRARWKSRSSRATTSPQTYASAQTYAKRYTLLNVLALAPPTKIRTRRMLTKRPTPNQISPKLCSSCGASATIPKTKPAIEKVVEKLTVTETELETTMKSDVSNRLSSKRGVREVAGITMKNTHIRYRRSMDGSTTGSHVTKEAQRPHLQARHQAQPRGYYELIANASHSPDGENVMDRGKRLEDEAIERFAKETGKKVNMILCSGLETTTRISPCPLTAKSVRRKRWSANASPQRGTLRRG